MLLAPILLIGVVIAAPAVIGRLLQGVVQQEETEVSTHVEVDFNQDELDQRLITSGRIIARPLVIDSIYKQPFIGGGREAMQNAGVTLEIIEKHGRGEYFPHPHNAYLQCIQDNSVLGAIPVFLFYLYIIKYSWSLFRETDVRIYTVTGGVCFALVFAFLIASSGSQTFYPREGAVGMWVGTALMLRFFVERNKVNNGQISLLITPKELSFGGLLSKI